MPEYLLMWPLTNISSFPSAHSVGSTFAQSIEQLADKLSRWFNAIILNLPNVVLAIVVVITFFYLAKLFKHSVSRVLNRLSKNQAANRIVSNFTSIFVMIIGLSISLGVMKWDTAVSSLLAGAGLLGIAIGFAFQDIIINFISSIIIAVKRPFNIGDLIESNGFYGHIQSMDFRSITILNHTGQRILLSNRSILEHPTTNYSYTRKRRIDIKVGVAYDEDLKEVRKVTMAAILQVKGIDPTKPIDFFYEDFGESAVNFVVRFWIPFSRQKQYLEMRSQAIMLVHEAFRENDISIPFPVTTIELSADVRKSLNGKFTRTNVTRVL